MALEISHVYADAAKITYYGTTNCNGLVESFSGTMDEIAEHICDVMVKHNFERAEACSFYNDEMLLTVKRS